MNQALAGSIVVWGLLLLFYMTASLISSDRAVERGRIPPKWALPGLLMFYFALAGIALGAASFLAYPFLLLLGAVE